MVAITVILAAVIGTFVLGLGDSVESAPQASINFDYTTADDEIEIRHRGGDSFDPADLELRVDGSEVSGNADNGEITLNASNGDQTFSDVASDPFRAGNSVVVVDEDGFERGTQADLVFVGGDSGTVIASFEVPRNSTSVNQ